MRCVSGDQAVGFTLARGCRCEPYSPGLKPQAQAELKPFASKSAAAVCANVRELWKVELVRLRYRIASLPPPPTISTTQHARAPKKKLNGFARRTRRRRQPGQRAA